MQFLVFPLVKDMRLASIGWLIFLVCASLYCIVYNQMVLLTAASFADSFLWSLKEYAHWLLVTPVLLVLLQRFCHASENNNRNLLFSLSAILLIALATRTLVDSLLTPSTNPIANIVDIFPSQVCTLAMISILWKLSRFPHSSKAEITNNHKPMDKVLVMKGNGEKLIQWDSVISITAAGNYLELVAENEQYLLRTTMKQLDEKLPKDRFIRIHRSYIVNITRIEKIISQPAGNGLVYLCNGQQLPLSKNYKKQIRSFRLTAD